MAKHKLRQVPLVSDEGPAQPPLPGGWALAIFDALRSFAPALAEGHQPRISDRTDDRIKKGSAPVKQITYDDIEARLVEVIASLFPRTAQATKSIGKFVNEYFRLWTFSAEAAPLWAKIHGFQPSRSGVLARALVRDLVLRLCFLESCERKLSGKNFNEWELSLLNHDSPAHVYRTLISHQKLSRGLSQKALAKVAKIDEKALYRFRKGHQLPRFRQMLALKPKGEDHRMLGGIGFFDSLLRHLNLRDSDLPQELLAWTQLFLPTHREALDSFVGSLPDESGNGESRWKSCDFATFVSSGELLLLLPGLEEVLIRMPDTLLRCHLYALRFAQFMDLARAYYQFAEPGNERGLDNFLRTAENESDCCPYGWMNKLRENNNVLPIQKSTPPAADGCPSSDN